MFYCYHFNNYWLLCLVWSIKQVQVLNHLFSVHLKLRHIIHTGMVLGSRPDRRVSRQYECRTGVPGLLQFYSVY